jgi:antiviral helicase SLH1
MLVCAPTGAGKTDVAMLSILRVLSQHLLPPIAGSRTPDVPRIAKDDFKIIYVAPMKALAAEVVRKFGKRLAWIGIQVRELTGSCAELRCRPLLLVLTLHAAIHSR